MKQMVLLAIALLLCMAQTMAQEDYNKAQRPPQQKEVVLNRNLQTRGGHDSFQYAYNAALREARQTYPNKNVGIRNLTKGDLKINSDGSVSYYYNYTIVELPDASMQKVYAAINKATQEVVLTQNVEPVNTYQDEWGYDKPLPGASFMVEGLEPGTYQFYVVCSDYDNSFNSVVREVTLLGGGDHGYELGDVNHDKKVSIADVTALIDLLLSDGDSGGCSICANVNQDDKVSIADVTALIDMLLSGN